MKAEIISIGSELTSGRNLDTNSQWLSRQLQALGFPVRFHTTLADDLEENIAALRVAVDRADLILCTGGLGPTQDDLTREALASVAGVELVFDQGSYDAISHIFQRIGRQMTERNRVQAYFPRGACIIPNPVGTAPGIWLAVPRAGRSDAVIVALPGVPREMHHLFEKQVSPKLLDHFPQRAGVILERKLNTFGLGEAAVEEKLLDLTRRGHVPEVGITASDATISLRIFGQGADLGAAEAQITPVEAIIRERLGSLVFGTDDDELQHAVARLLAEKQKTVAVAESLTGGLVMNRLCQIPGISAHFLGGCVAYANEAKVSQLDVPEKLLSQHGAVSAAVAEAMAKGARARFATDLAISTTGIAGPGGATETKPVGLAYVGIAGPDGVTSHQVNAIMPHRLDIMNRVAKVALNVLRLQLLKMK
ncbi:MAG TPA: competence/damage-inducible protein A [Gemmatales bacterium]|nr:competence/damage-inducible protein A [Gemmatales bacterium]